MAYIKIINHRKIFPAKRKKNDNLQAY